MQARDINKSVFDFNVVTNGSGQYIPSVMGQDFRLAVSMGMIDGYSVIDKFAVNQNITTTSDPEDVIEQGGSIQYDTNGTAPIQYFSSDDALDVGQTISIQGLDIDGNDITQTITSNGQTVVTLDTPLWRAYRMINNSDDGGDINGTVYLHTQEVPTLGVPDDENIRLIIIGDKNQTLYGGYTVPLGKVGFLYRGELGIELEGNVSALAEYAHLHYASRRYGKVFTVKKAITCLVGGNSTYQDERTFPDVIPSLTDIKISVEEVSQDMGIWAAFDMLLVDEDKLSDTFLASIGQQGY